MTGDLLLFVAIGFAAQLVDGAIGMAYGITATTILLSSGVPPAIASASVHMAEIFTTAASGLAHWRAGNVDRRMVVRLAVPGMIGGAIGAAALALAPAERIRPLVAGYLLAMGCVILWRVYARPRPRPNMDHRTGVLGFCGGFLDAAGGGGWGAMVTTTLIGHGVAPRFAIGSANTAEFFVTVVITAMFIVTLGQFRWLVITGLVLGGVLAAPMAAYATKWLPDRPMMILVGTVVILLSLRNLAALS